MAKFKPTFAPRPAFSPPAARAPAPVVAASPPSAPPAPPVVIPPPAPPEAFWRVVQTCQVPRGASHFTLNAGKVISSRGYDIPKLMAMGVPLESVDSGANPVRAIIVG